MDVGSSHYRFEEGEEEVPKADEVDHGSTPVDSSIPRPGEDQDLEAIADGVGVDEGKNGLM